MAYIHDLDYYGGNANNQRYLESLAAAKAAPAASTIPYPVAQSQAVVSIGLTDAQQAIVSAAEVAAQLVPVVPANPPAWKAKA